MSAFVVNREHISYLLKAAYYVAMLTKSPFSWIAEGTRFRYLSDDNKNEVGQMLWDANIKGVMERYPDTAKDELPGKISDYPYKFECDPDNATGLIDWVHVLCSIDCYEYQAEELTGWKETEAYRFIDALRCQAIQQLPGYDKAPWGYPLPSR